ncbi:MAG: Fumarylacetoacetate (FAA) hydrolase family protein [Candidatus Kentron sp. G]|nr:MAG: Fumarylacetoacetate (FAA) hydrolase family protein [Candidatus Kentron sp. G]VFN06289.1 MAG: Fumarylacetoacetate (FAA) hydrolase family protein [Candidatus Kentron sp. G]VFN07281.1 MAG: Fumarylacetoacetate (FAA) hydrolase family protein [Candidatus Kentron sp. G]
MKLVTFSKENGMEYIGALIDDERNIAVLQVGVLLMDDSSSPFFTDMLAFLQGDAAARDKAQAVVEFITTQRPPDSIIAVDSVTLLAPVPRPESMRDCLGFEQHLINFVRATRLKKIASFDEWVERTFGRRKSMAGRAIKTFYERPIYYKGNRFSVIGPDAPMQIPAYTKRLDYELELGIFIGRKGVDIPKGKARDYIGGYTLFNDFSARDIQRKEGGGRLGPAKGKDFDTGNAIGPCLVTPDEIPDPYSLTMTARVNGQEWSRGSSAELYWSFEDTIEYISQSETLHPGEFIGSGTCSGAEGCGCGIEMGKFLQAGDLVELEAERIGILRNWVVSP